MSDFNNAEVQQGQEPPDTQSQAMADDLDGAKGKDADQVENEYADLCVENEKGEIPVSIPSDAVETFKKDGALYTYGFIDGNKFEVPCDTQIMLHKDKYAVFKNALSKHSNPVEFINSLKAEQ